MTGLRESTRGTSLHSTSGLYRAYLWLSGRQYNLGYYVTEEEARAAYVAARAAYEASGKPPKIRPRNQRCRDHFPRPRASRWGTGIQMFRGRFDVSISIRGKHTYIGRYSTQEEAVLARDAAVEKAKWKQ